MREGPAVAEHHTVTRLREALKIAALRGKRLLQALWKRTTGRAGDPQAPEVPVMSSTAYLTHGPIGVVVRADHEPDLDELAWLLRPSVTVGFDERDHTPEMRLLSLRRLAGTGTRLQAELDRSPLVGDSIPLVARSLLARLSQAVMEAEPMWTHLHAGTVSIAGRGIVIPAKSGAGKSNLVATLAAGRGLLTDELVAIDRGRGLIRAAPRPVCLKAESRERGQHLAPTEDPPKGDAPWLLPAAALSAHPQSIAVPWVIVLPSRRPGVVQLETMHPAEVLMELISQCTDITVDPQRALHDLTWLAAVAPALRVEYRDAVDAAPVIARHVSDLHERPSPRRWHVVAEVADGKTQLARSAEVLSVVVDGCAVLWRPDTQHVLRLDDQGAMLWEYLDGFSAVPDALAPIVEDLVRLQMVD